MHKCDKIYLLGFTPCAPNRLPHHDIQEQSQKSCANICQSSICKNRTKVKSLVAQFFFWTSSCMTSIQHPPQYPLDPPIMWHWIEMYCPFPARNHGPVDVIDCTVPFHTGRISCHRRDQSMFEGGLTTARRNLRPATSSWWRSFWWTVRCPQPKARTSKNNISSANLGSSSFGKPSCRSMPHCACSTSSLHSRIAHCRTDVQSFGLRTFPSHARVYRKTIAQVRLTFNDFNAFLLLIKALNYPNQMFGNTMWSKSGPQFRPIDSIKCFGQIQADNPNRFAHSQQLQTCQSQGLQT